MPTEGIFAVVERGGTVRKGDKITVGGGGNHEACKYKGRRRPCALPMI